MNKMILIAVGVILFVGVSYHVKKTYDSEHGNVNGVSTTTNVAKNPDGTVAASNIAPGTVAVGTVDTTAQNGVTATTANGVVDTHANSGTTAITENHTTGSLSATGVSGGAGVGTTAVGTTGVAGVNPGKTAVVKTEPEKPKDNCFAFEYRHKKEARSQDIENFLDYTNAFPIARADYNPKSVCVKVNQKAVNYQVSKGKSGAEIRIGSMVGPESVIRVSYCVGKISPCHETCVQPKKRFMDDMMNDTGEEDSFSDSWGKGEDEKGKQALKEKSKELRAIASENDHLNEASVQRDWEELQKQEWVCK